VKVTDPEGNTWRVSRRWVPWRRRLKGALDSAPDMPSFGDDPISFVLGVIFLIIMIPFLILFVVAGLELLLLLLVLPFAVLGRMLFGRHWKVEVRRGFTVEHEVDAGDWRSSATVIQDLADLLRQGRPVAPGTVDS
jgi:hypothetical protein